MPGATTGRKRAVGASEAEQAVFGLTTEDDLLVYVRNTAGLAQFLYYHPTFSIKGPSGFPDVVLVHRTSGRTIIAELKREGLWPTPDRMKGGRWLQGQRTWLDALSRGPVEAYLWWPSDARDIADILTDGPRDDMPCVVRLRKYLGVPTP